MRFLVAKSAVGRSIPLEIQLTNHYDKREIEHWLNISHVAMTGGLFK